MSFNSKVIELARNDLGTWEFAGAEHNPKVLAYYDDAGHPEIGNDEVPWCAAFVGAMIARAGGSGTNSLLAQSYLGWGVEVDISDAKPGDVVVFKRGSKSWQGHVGFFEGWAGSGFINLLGGNQGNQVNIQKYSVTDGRLLGVRRAAGELQPPLILKDPIQTDYPTLVKGMRGRFVEDAQEMLIGHGFFVGLVDGRFGRKTHDEVLAFQSNRGLLVDGKIGSKTWKELMEDPVIEERDVSIVDLRERGSSTVQAADKGQATVAIGGSVTAVVAGIDAVSSAGDSLAGAEGALETAQGILMTYWPILAVAVAGFLVWRYLGQIKSSRLRDARTGKNMGR